MSRIYAPIIGSNVLEGGVNAQDGNNYPGPYCGIVADDLVPTSGGVVLYDGTMASGSNIINCASGLFTGNDKGKVIGACTQALSPTTGAGRLTTRAGTIVQVNSATQIVVSFTAPSALTGMLVVYGPDVGHALQAALNSVSAAGGGAVELPNGNFLSTIQLIVPNNCSLAGRCNTPQAFGAGAARGLIGYGGTTLFCVAPTALTTEPFVELGTSEFLRNAPGLYNINIDTLQRAQDCVSATLSWGANVDTVTMIGGTRYTFEGGSSTTCRGSYIAGMSVYDVCSVTSGDARYLDNYIWGQQLGRYGMNIGNVDNIQVIGNHFFRGGEASLADAAYSLVLYYDGTGSQVKGGITIIGNSFDHSGAEHVRIRLFNSGTTLRGVTIANNHGYQNQYTPNDTFSWMDIRTDAGCVVKGLSVTGNTGRGAWDGPTTGRPKHFCNGSAMAAANTVVGATFVGNTIQDLTSTFYNAFTPDHSSGNIAVNTAGVASVV